MEAKNHTDGMAHQLEKTLKDNEGKVAAADKTEAEAAITAAREAMEGTDTEALKSATERLSTITMKIGEAVYKAEQAEPTAADAKPGAKDETVVDAEFEEVDPKKKSA